MSEERVLSDLVWTPEQGLATPEVRGISWENFLLSDEKYMGKWRTDSGIRITPETAIQSTVVLACCRILAETCSVLPLHVYRRNADGGDEIAKEIPLYKVLTFRPNDWQTKQEFFEQMVMTLTLWGNSYTRIRSGQYGSVSQLDNLHPSRMDVERLENGRLRYSYTDPETGRLERYTQDQIMHVRWTPEQDGIKGMVPVEIAREAIGLARACEQHAARFWANSARPGVVLQTDGTLTAEAAERLRDNWERIHKGSDRSSRTAVLTGGIKATELGMSNEASQFQSSREFQCSEIARVYRIPQHLIQGTPGGDLEVQGQEFVTYTLMPWLNRIESAISRSLIYNDDEYYAKFDVRGLLRANSNQRASYYSTMIGLGIFSINDCRKAEGMKSLGPDGDHHFVAMNTQTLEEAVKPKPEAPAGGPPGMPGGGGGGDGPPPPAPGGPPSLPEVKTGKAPIASPKGEASQPKEEEAIEEYSADWEDALEARAFCATGEGQGTDNSCSSSGGTGTARVDSSWKKEEDEYSFVPGEGKSPIVGGDDIQFLRIESPKVVADTMKEMKVKSLTDIVKIGGGLTRGSLTKVVATDGEIHVLSDVPVDPDNKDSDSMTSSVRLGVDEDGKKFVDYDTMAANEDTANLSGESAARMSSILLEKFPESIAAAEKAGFSYATTFAMGNSEDEFKGYRLWPQFGFDAEIYRNIRKGIPKDIVPHDDPVTIQQLIATPAGKKWWNENGRSMEMKLDLKDKKSDGYKQYKKMAALSARLKKRNEGRSLFEVLFPEYRSFCPNGEGNGVTNDCGSKNGGSGPREIVRLKGKEQAEAKNKAEELASLPEGSVKATDKSLINHIKFVPNTSKSNKEFAKVPSDDKLAEAMGNIAIADKDDANKSDIGGVEGKTISAGDSWIGFHRDLPDGTQVAFRIDIPTFNNSKKTGSPVYSVTVHEDDGRLTSSVGPRIGYDGTARMSGPVNFFTKEKNSLMIATGAAGKNPIATVKGKFDQSREIPEDIDSWTPVGYDPQKAAYFYDKRTGQEVRGGTDAVSVGNTVFTRSPDYGDRNAKTHYRSADEMFACDSWGLESRAYCGTGPGGGIDNSCGPKTAAVVREVLASIEKTGGFSVHPVSAKSPTTGFMCATVPHAEKIFESSEEITQPAIQSYLDQHADFLSENPQLHLGGWIDPKTEKVYLDLSERFEDEASAVAAGVKHNQIAVWDIAGKREVRIRRDDEQRQAADSVRLPAGGGSEGDCRSPEQGSRGNEGEEESRRFCSTGEGGGIDPSCGNDAGDAPSDSFGNVIDAAQRSPSSTAGGGGGRVNSDWKKVERPMVYDRETLQSEPPCKSLADVESVSIINGKALGQSLKETGVTLDQAAKVCGNLSPESNVTIVHGSLETAMLSGSDPEPTVTVISHQPFGETKDAIGTAATLSRSEDDEIILSYVMFSVAPEAQKESPVAVARGLYSGVVKSINEAEKIGVDEVGMLAAGSDSNDQFKGYRIWPRLGFDGVIPRSRVTPTYSLRLGFFEPYGSSLPDDILSDKAKQEKSEGALTIQSLYETKAGQRWWEENGGAMGMFLRVGDNEDPGWQRFKRISSKVSDRDIIDVLEVEWRAIRSEVESRAFCATGEGNGIDNSCGAGGGQMMAPDRDGGGSASSTSTSPGAGRPASVTVESHDSLNKAMNVIGVSSVDDVVTLAGGNVRGAKVDVYGDESGFVKVSALWPINKKDRAAGQVFTEVSMGMTEEGKVLGFEAFGPTGGTVDSPAAQQTVISIISEKVAESIDAAEKNGFVAVTTFAVGDADNEYKGYRLWPQFGFDADLPRDFTRRIPPELILKSKGIEIPAPGSTSIPQHLVIKSLASQHRDLTIQELLRTREGDRWWDENGDDINLKLDLTDKTSLGYQRWEKMKSRLPRLKARNETRAFFDAWVQERGFCPTGEGGGILNTCGNDDNGGPTDAFGGDVGGFQRTPSASKEKQGGGGGSTEAPASSSAQWKTGDTIPDAFETVSAAKPVSRDESGDIVTDVFDQKDISPFAGEQFVSPIACGRYLADMTAQTRGEAIDSKKPLSEESMSFLVEAMVQQVQSAEGRGYTPAFYSDQERQAQLEAYSKIHPILRGGRTASGLCIGQEDEDGNCTQGESITTEGQFLFRAVQAMTSPQASPLPNMQRADEVLTNFFENPNADKAALGAGSVAGNASKVAKANLARLQKIIDKVGLTAAAEIFSQPPVRAGDLDDFFEEKLGLKGYKAGGYAVDQVVPVFSVFGPKVGPFFANNNGDTEALTADVWFSRTWGRLTGELVQETNPKLAKDHADVLSRRMRYVTDEDLRGTSREDFEASVKQMEKSGEIPASVAAWAENRSKRYGKEGFNKGVKGVRDKEVARLSIAIINNLVSTLDDPGTTVRRSNMIDVINEVSQRTGHPPAFVQDLLWQDEQDIWSAAGARTSTDIGQASLYSTGIDKMVENPMMRFPIKKAAEAEKKKSKSKSSKTKKRSIDVDSREYEDDIDGGRGWIEQLSFDAETEEVSPDEFADAFIEFAESQRLNDKPEDRSTLESVKEVVIELRSAGLNTILMPNAGRDGLHVMGFDADIPKDLVDSLPESLSHCQTLLDLHVTGEGRSWWEQNGRDVDVTIDLDGIQGRIFDSFAAEKRWEDIIEEGILDDYGNS